MADEVVVETISFKLVNEKADPIKASIEYAIFNASDIADNLMAAQFNGYDKKARKMINFAANPDKFSPGLPEVEMGTQINWESYFQEEFPVDRDFSEFRVFPVVPIRENGVSLSKDVNYDRYKETRRILKKVSLPLADLIEGMEGTEEEPNPDVDNLDDVYFLFGTDMYSTTEASAEYMWNLFDALIPLSEIDKIEWELAPHIVNYFKWSLDQFNAKVSYQFVSGHEETDVVLQDEDGKSVEYQSHWYIGDIVPIEIPDDPADPLSFIEGAYLVAELVIKKQIAPGIVDVRIMHGPVHHTIVDALGEQRHVLRGADGSFVGLDPNSEDPEEAKKAGSAAYFLPMIQEVVDVSNSKNSSLMLYDGATLVMYAAQSVHLAWYQSFWFSAILTMVSVVLSIVPYVGQGLAAVVQNIIIAIASSLILNFVLDLIMTKVGGKLGAILAGVVLIAAAAYGARGGGGGMPMATVLMHAVKAIGKAMVMYQQNQLEAMQKDMEDFNKDAKERQEEINEAADMLGEGSLDPLMLVSAIVNQNPDETPNDFYTRTIHTGNPGVVSLEAVEEFVGNLLLLPDGSNLNPEVYEKLK